MELKTQIFSAILISHIIMSVVMTARCKVPSETDSMKTEDLVRNRSSYPLTLIELGEVDGKSYFVEANQFRGWRAAKAYCEASGLKLATIETKNQADFLNLALRQYPISIGYWTALRESRRPTMMEWDSSEIPPDMSIFPKWIWETPPYQYCSLFQLDRVDYSMQVSPCENTEHILCQS